ncbi:MAG: LamG-like jellyroll fold domain-containing protein, partial [Candidatus Pacearchaeota archaeon]
MRKIYFLLSFILYFLFILILISQIVSSGLFSNFIYNYSRDIYHNGTKATENFLYLDFNKESIYSNLTAYYSFDAGNSTNTFDISGNNRHGTFMNGAFSNQSCDSGFGPCGSFDGVNDWFSTNINLQGSYTLIFWAKFNLSVFVNGGPVWGGSSVHNYVTYYSSSGFYWYNSWSGLYNPYVYINNNVWTMYSFGFNGTHRFICKNDVCWYKSDSSSPHPNPNFRLFADKDGNGGYFLSQVDEVMIFNTSLTQPQIQDIYNNQSQRFKNNGTATLLQQTLNETGNNLLAWRINSTNLFNTSVYGRLGYWDVSKGYDTNISGLVAYYTADGHANDISGNNNNGIFMNGAHANSQGVYNNSFFFDGSDDFIEINDINFNNITIISWVKVNSFPSSYGGSIVSQWDDVNGNFRAFAFYPSNANKFLCQFDGDGYPGDDPTAETRAVFTNVWYHVVCQFSPYKIRIYLNGNLEQEINTNFHSVFNSNQEIMIGRTKGYGGSPRFFNGQLDEVMIFNRSLNADEIKEIYVKGRAKWNYTEEEKFLINEVNFSIQPNISNILPILRLESQNGFYTPYVLNNNFFQFNDTIVPI